MWIELALGLLLLLALAQGAVLLRLWRGLQAVREELAALRRDAAGAVTDVPTSMLVAALGRIERRLRQVPTAPPAPGRSWELAQQLAREGADVEQLVTRCGLSRDEAQLLLKMRMPVA